MIHYTNTSNPIDFPKVDKMNEREREVMNILSEECAEVIQAVSKCHRFGLDNLKPGKPKTNREHLEEELGDLYAMIEILQEMDVISWTNIEQAALDKREKLKKWSNIFTENIS
jgi:NTP pyrophosphatase (non-canonical NTP hydrolase)